MWKLEHHFNSQGMLLDKQPMVTDGLQKTRLHYLPTKKRKTNGGRAGGKGKVTPQSNVLSKRIFKKISYRHIRIVYMNEVACDILIHV